MFLRGHHTICLLGFQGYGYSDSFVDKMNELAPIYKNQNIDIDIFLTPNTDEICMNCPAINGENCTNYHLTDEKIRNLDNRILNHLGLKSNRYYKKSHILKLIKDKVEPHDLDFLCSGCKWLDYGFCKEAITNLKQMNAVF